MVSCLGRQPRHSLQASNVKVCTCPDVLERSKASSDLLTAFDWFAAGWVEDDRRSRADWRVLSSSWRTPRRIALDAPSQMLMTVRNACLVARIAAQTVTHFQKHAFFLCSARAALLDVCTHASVRTIASIMQLRCMYAY